MARPGTTLLVVAIGFSYCAPDGGCISIKRGEFEYTRLGILVLEGAIWLCIFGGRLFTVVVSWLTIDGLCCGNRQWLIFGTNFWSRGIVGIFGTGGTTERTTLCTRLSFFLKSFVDERLITQRGVWDGSSDVRCKDWVRNGKVVRMSGFGVVLLSVWTWWGAWVRGSVYCWGWMICCRKSRNSGVWCSGDKINFLSGAYSLGRIILG